MVKIALLLLSQQMMEEAACFYRAPELEVIYASVVNKDNLSQHTQRAEALGAEIIVSRGGFPAQIRQMTDIPVIGIKLTGQEIALLLHKAMGKVARPHPFIGVTCTDTAVGDMSYFEEVLGIKVQHYPVNLFEDIPGMVQNAVKDGVDILICGQYAAEYCRSHGYPHIDFEGTEDCMRETLIQVQNTAYAIELKKQNVAYLETVLNYSFNGIIEMDVDGTITRINRVAAKIIGKDSGRIVGSSLRSVLRASDADALLAAAAENRELYASIVSISGTDVVMNLAPVLVGGTARQIILSFHEMRKLARKEADARREQYLQRHVAAGHFDLLERKSKSIQDAIKTARKYAQSLAPVLLVGEPGTEEELFAQSIHNASQYANGSFVTLDCDAALGVSYLALRAVDGAAPELYLVERLAEAARQADYGTLYLTDIDLLSLSAQHVLLHLITDRMIFPAGGGKPEPAAVRIIATSQRSLLPLVQKGLFRQDLCLLLTALTIPVPPLRQRREDLPRLIEDFMQKHFTSFSRHLTLSERAMHRLIAYDWPGNLHQLHAFLECLLLNATAQTISENTVASLLDKLYPQKEIIEGDTAVIIYQSPEAVKISELLAKHLGDRGKVAQELGVSKSTLWRKMKKYKIID